jgi:tetratricopeptide (TPR) repeat protein
MSSASTGEPSVGNGRPRSHAKLRELLWADPANEALWRQCAAVAADLGDYTALEELARTRLAIDATHREALFHSATASIGLSNPGAAIAPLEALRQDMPDEPAVLSNLGLCHYSLRQFAEAASHLEHSYELGRREPDLLRLLVSSYHHVGRIDDAVKVAAANVEAARRDPALAGVLALAFLDGNDAARAQRCAAWALNGNPRSIDGLVVQGTLDLGRLDLAGAQARFNAVIEQSEQNGRAWIGLGTAALLRGQVEQAKSVIRRGLEHLQGHVGSWHLLAWAELITGQIDEAHRLFEHALDSTATCRVTWQPAAVAAHGDPATAAGSRSRTG